ncbi:MAG: gephyrin-like molybdotransferase Glp [Thermodesulfobacteriota bacterium]
MKDFFKVADLDEVFRHAAQFQKVETEILELDTCVGRVLSADLVCDEDLPPFRRSIVDGYAVTASSTFGASEANPGYLNVKGEVSMGSSPAFAIGIGEAAYIPTGAMLPKGSDSVVMIEHAGRLDDTTIEVYKSVAPGQNVIEAGEDFKKNEVILKAGTRIRSQECGLLAAFGNSRISVYRKPVVGIISTGDEVVSVHETPRLGQIRDINSYTLAGLVKEAGGIPVSFGIVTDDHDILYERCRQAMDQCDMIFLSGGSSVGTRDMTVQVLSELPDAQILVHGISISPGKPTILSKAGNKCCWGLPGHVVSAMIVFSIVVRPFLDHIGGLSSEARKGFHLTAKVTRNIPSAQGRTDFIRARLLKKDGVLWAEPILGKSGLINTMVKADGIIQIPIHTEGLDEGSDVEVIPV